jgi:cytochrome b561
MQNRDLTSLSITRRIIELQRTVAALLQSESTRHIVMQLHQSLTNLLLMQLRLQLRVKWTPEQLARQQERLERQQARLEWQQAMIKQLQEKQGNR